MYTCVDSGYETSRKVNFVRHKNRKDPCLNTMDGGELQSIEQKTCDVNVDGENANVDGKNKSKHPCNKYKKRFSNLAAT